MTKLEKSRLDAALSVVPPLRNALAELPGRTDPLAGQLRDAGKSLCAWIEALATGLPTADGGTSEPDGEPLDKATLEHMALIANSASAAGWKLATTEADGTIQGRYKYVSRLSGFVQLQLNAIWWDYPGL